MRTVRERLLDIVDSIAKIQARQPATKQAFVTDELIQVWMVYHLTIIGEAVSSLDPTFKSQHNSIPWRQIAGLRNIVVHEYFRTDYDVVWATILTDVPVLKQ